ncbi:MAG: PQQ-binding-like beta-propeller repeat protein, partial [Myxococcota bacterium]
MSFWDLLFGGHTAHTAHDEATLDGADEAEGSSGRRTFLRTLGLGAGGLLLPTRAWAKKPKKKASDARRNWIEPEGLTGAPLDLPAWSYGDSSTATDTMLMFRGNPTHTFYGTGPVSERPSLQWQKPLARFHTTLRGRKVTWTGTGWSGQPVKYGKYVFVGGQGGYVYAFEAATGKIRWRFRGRRMFKGSSCFYKNRLYIGNT